MEIMPPPGSKRRRVAMGVVFGFLALGTGVIVYDIVKWIRHEANFPGWPLAFWLGGGIYVRGMWVASRKEESRESEGLDEGAGDK